MDREGRWSLWLRGLRIAGAIGLGVWLSVASIALYRHYADPAFGRTIGWRELAAALDRLSAGIAPERVRLIQNYPDPTLWYYYRGPVPHLALPPAPHDAEGTATEVARLVAEDVERVVLVIQEEGHWDDTGVAAQGLAQRYPLVAEQAVRHWTLQVYDRPATTLVPVEATLGPITLAGANMSQSAVASGGVLAVHLHWRGDVSALRGSEKLTLQLLDSADRLVAQTDRPLTAAELTEGPSSYGLSIPHGTVTGQYRLILALYDPALPGMPRLQTGAGADHLVLGVVEVFDAQARR